MQAAAKHKWGSDDLAGKTVAIQGCGHVGCFLAAELARVGAKLIVTDVDATKVKHVADDHHAMAVKPEEIYSVDADIFAPCALGGVLNDQTIPQLKAILVVARPTTNCWSHAMAIFCSNAVCFTRQTTRQTPVA